MNMQEGDSERDRPRRLTEPKEQDGTQSRRTETGGSPHPAHNRPDEWVVKREGWSSPNVTLNSGFSLTVSVASLGSFSSVEEYMGEDGQNETEIISC